MAAKRVLYLLEVGLVLGVLFMATAAPGGGGSGSGGGGGGAIGGIDYVPGTPDYWPLNKDVGPNLIPGLILLAVLGIPLGILIWRMRGPARARLIHVVLLLPEGCRCLPELDRIVGEADLGSFDGRELTLRRISGLLRSTPVGRVAVSLDRTASTEALREAAERLWSAQMARARLRMGRAVPRRRAADLAPDQACVLGVVLVVPAGFRVPPSTVEGVTALLRQMGESTAGTETLFVYYAPDFEQSLDQEAAEELFERLASSPAGPGAHTRARPGLSPA